MGLLHSGPQAVLEYARVMFLCPSLTFYETQQCVLWHYWSIVLCNPKSVTFLNYIPLHTTSFMTLLIFGFISFNNRMNTLFEELAVFGYDLFSYYWLFLDSLTEEPCIDKIDDYSCMHNPRLQKAKRVIG